jgi:hypothetical protein
VPVDARTLTFGEWHPVVRDPLDVLRGVFVVAAIVYALLGGAGVAGLIVAALAVVGVRFLYLPRPFDLAFILAMTLTGWGEALRLYDRFGDYDVVVHFLVPLFGAPCVYIALARLDTLPDLADASGSSRHLGGIFVVTFALGLAIGPSGRSSSGFPITRSARSSKRDRTTRSATSSRTQRALSAAGSSSLPGPCSAGRPCAASRAAPSARTTRLG